jgi:creatinine amidohydrolase
MGVASGYWQDLTTLDFARLDPEGTIALLPVAAIEQHGPHLPLATDALINAAIVTTALQRLTDQPTVLVLPAMNIGSSLEHTGFAGTLSVDAETVMAGWKAIGASVARAGVRKLVILNTHGGQVALVDLVALALRVEQQMFVARANYFSFGTPPGLFETDELAHGIHGGAVETSLMLHLRPDLVREEAIGNFEGLPGAMASGNRVLGAEKPVGFGWMSQDLHAAGVCGDATRGDAQRGAAYLEHLAGCLVTLLIEIADTPLSVLHSGAVSQ